MLISYLFVSLIILFTIVIIWVTIDLLVNQSRTSVKTPKTAKPGNQNHEDAVLVVQTGGKIKFINGRAKSLFEISDSQKVSFSDLENKTGKKDLYKLFNEPGKSILTIKEQNYEAHSYLTSDGMLVSFQPINLTEGEIYLENALLSKTTSFLEIISRNQDLGYLLKVFFEEFRNIFLCDYFEVGFIDEIDEEIYIFNSRHFDPDEISNSKASCQFQKCFAGLVIQKNQKTYLKDPASEPFIFDNPLIDDIKELLGIPIIVGNQTIGALVFGNREMNGFSTIEKLYSSSHWNQLEMILHNAWLSDDLRRKSSELSGLSKLTVSLSHIKNPQELIQTILSNYGKLIPIDIFGFILFNDRTQILEAMKPFQGLPDPIVEIIRNKIEPESPAEKIIYSQDVLIIDDAMDNPQWDDLGLTHLANAASIKEAVLIPLSPGSDPMGFLLAANHHNDTVSFSQDEIYSLMIVANQTAPLIENLFLLMQSKQRAQQAELLRRISSIANSNATIEEVLAFSINEISLLLHADFGGLFLLDHNSTKLVWNESTKFRNLTSPEDFSELLISSPEFQHMVTYLKEPLLIGKFNETKPIPGFYQQSLDESNIQSAIIVPLVVRNQGVGELWIGSQQLNFFDEGDIQIVFSVGNQLAYVVDRDKLSTLTQAAMNEKNKQEKLIDELQKLNLFGKKIVNLESQQIYEELLNSLLVAIPDANSGWIGRLDEGRQYVIPTAYKEYSKELSSLSFGEITLPMQSLIKNEIISINEINFPDAYGLNEAQAIQYLQATHHQIPTSCIFAPIQTTSEQFGVLALEIFDPERSFSSEDESIILSFLQQGSFALENANLIDSLKSQSRKMEILADLSKTISSNLNPEDLRNSLLQQLKTLVDYENATFWNLENKSLIVVATAGFQDTESRVGIRAEIDDSLIIKELIKTKKPVVISDANQDLRFPALIESENLSWLGIPLMTQKGISGVIALEKKEGNYYGSSLVQIAEAFASQAAIALENANLFQESNNRSLLLDERSQKLSYLNRFSSEVNQLLEVTQIYSLTSQSLFDLLKCDMVSIFSVRESGNVELVFTSPPVPKQIFINQPFFEKLQQSGGVYQQTDISRESDLDFLNERLFDTRGSKSILLIPLLKSEKVFGWICLESTNTRKYLHREVELGQTLTNQAAMAINNAVLFYETNDYKENLEERVQERTRELMIEHRNTEILLKISSELASSMDIDQIMSSTMRIINRSLGLFGSFIYINENKRIIQRFENDNNLGNTLITQKLGQRIQKVRKTKSVLLDNEMRDDSFIIKRGSLLLVPVIFGEVVLGELVMFAESENFFMTKDVNLGEAIAGQISMALNNSEIFNLVREQSENLGVLFREQEVETTRSQAMLEAVADGVLVTGNQGNIVLLNKSGKDILKVKSISKGEKISNIQTYYGEGVKPWLSIINNWTIHPNTIQRNAVYSERINLDNGQVISIHLSPVIWKNEFLGTVSVFRDITFEVQIDQLKSDFISNISHELRTPLTSIKGFVEVLLMEASGSLNEQQMHFMEVIQNNTTRLNKLVDEILDVSKIESGQFKLTPEPVDLSELLVEVVTDQERISSQEKKTIQFQANLASNLPKIFIDRYRITQALNNILSNARIYSENEGIIKIQAELVNNFVKVSVKDSGIGLSKEDQKHAFERYYRGKNAVLVNSAGTGIGLSIAETLIKMHGGKIELDSSGIPGEGTNVTFWLPIPSKKDE